MTDLKRRVGAILDFITRAQVELANDNFATEFRASLPAAAANATSTSPTMMKKQQQQQQQPAAARKDNSAEKIATQGLVNGDDEKLANQQNGGEQSEEAEWEGFERLSGVEMMDILTTKLIRWQAEYGKLEK